MATNQQILQLQQRMSAASCQGQHEINRFLAELEFAEGLCALYPDKAPAWRKRMEKAFAAVTAAAKSAHPRTVQNAVRAAETLLAPLRKPAKTFTVHCVGHAHIDMNWMWSWPETVAVTNDTFSTVLRLMDEYPDFCFSQSQASVYAIAEKYNPAMLERIRQRVAEGRWEVTASHWVEGDKNLAGGESLCRHLLYTRRYMKKLFTLNPEDVSIDWSPDTFGHAHTIPSYLNRGAVTRYYCHRPGADGPKRPLVFWWKAPDGSRVVVRNDSANGYNGVIDAAMGRRALEFAKETGLRELMFVYGVGDHGGGPTRRDIERAHDMDAWPIFPNIRLTTTKPFYAMLERNAEKLPTLDCELNFEFTGCYTTQTLIKKCNRYAEHLLGDAESVAALLWAAFGREYPEDALREAWQNTLFAHFHDILPGSGVHDTRTYAHGLFQNTAATTSMIETQALRALAARIDTAGVASDAGPALPSSFLRSALGAGVGFGTGEGRLSAAEQSAGAGPRPFLVFNPCAWSRSGAVTATVWDNDPQKGWDANRLREMPFSVVAPSGKRFPAQVVDVGGYWGHMFATLAFPVEAVPALGYAVYTVVEERTESTDKGVRATGDFPWCSYAPLEHAVMGMENEFLRADIDAATGGLASLVDKKSGLNLVDPARPAGVLEFSIERPHGMSAWSLADTGPVSPLSVVSIERRCQGPHVATVEVKLRQNDSTFLVKYELCAGDPVLQIHVSGTWLERGSPERGVPVLRIAFPLALSDAQARYEIPFGAIDRALHSGEEVPALQWSQVSGMLGKSKAGCLLLNDSKHGHALHGNVLRLTLIRSAHEPDPLPEIGQHSIRLAVCPFAGIMPPAEAIRLGAAHNRPMRVVGTDVHRGDLSASASFVAVAPDNVVLSGLKKAEGADRLVVRLFETAGKRTVARIRLDETLMGPVREAVEADVLERPLDPSSATLEKGAVRVTIPPYGIATVLIRAAKER